MEDQELIKKLLNSNEEAMEELHHRYGDRLYHYIFMQTNHYQDAKELLQDVFLKTATQLHRFKGKSSFKTWIFKIARNTVIDYYRTNKQKEKEIITESHIIEETYQSESAELTAMRELHLDEVIQILEKLPVHYRTVLHLRFIEGFTTQETSEIMENSVFAVKAIQRRDR